MTRHREDLDWIAGSDYRSLIGETGWQRLHPDIRRRFSADQACRPATYRGLMREIYLSPYGYLLAHLCRLIDTPLALYSAKQVPMEVRVYADLKRGGMTWDRFYHYPNKALNRVRSTKCIRKDLGLIELVGRGFGMHLAVYEQAGALVFASRRFFWQFGRFRITIPDWLTPGKTLVKQIALNDGSFQFSFDVCHPLLGRLFHQLGTFRVDEALDPR